MVSPSILLPVIGVSPTPSPLRSRVSSIARDTATRVHVDGLLSAQATCPEPNTMTSARRVGSAHAETARLDNFRPFLLRTASFSADRPPLLQQPPPRTLIWPTLRLSKNCRRQGANP